MVDFATIKAPFDGVIVERDRRANVGAIVQKAETTPRAVARHRAQRYRSRGGPCAGQLRAFLTPETEAIFETPTLPGVKIHGKVTLPAVAAQPATQPHHGGGSRSVESHQGGV